MNGQTAREPGREIVCVQEVLEYSSEDNPWVKLYYDHVRFPNGRNGRYNRIVEGEKGKGVVVLPVASNGKVALIRIYRYPVGEWQWELPRGFSDPAMTAQQNARRELQEETGVIAKELVQLGSIFPNSGILTTNVEVFLAPDLDDDSVPLLSEQWAILEMKFFTMRELDEMIAHGLIQDAMTLAALTLARARDYSK
jgi:8-oxo-dGTP pyrophosphatase MutT (NUDIX family)